MNSSLELKKPSNWNVTNSRVLKLYRNTYNRVKPGSIKEIEFNSNKSKEKEKKHSIRFNSPARKVKLHELAKNHMSVHSGTKIIKLEMSPYGKHESYNKEDNFLKSHFIDFSKNITQKIAKKINLLKKKAHSDTKSRMSSRGYFKAMQNIDAYKTEAGVLYCKSLKNNLAFIEEREKYRLENINESLPIIDRKFIFDKTGYEVRNRKLNFTPN